jgi:hypothetical protein
MRCHFYPVANAIKNSKNVLKPQIHNSFITF